MTELINSSRFAKAFDVSFHVTITGGYTFSIDIFGNATCFDLRNGKYDNKRLHRTNALMFFNPGSQPIAADLKDKQNIAGKTEPTRFRLSNIEKLSIAGKRCFEVKKKKVGDKDMMQQADNVEMSIDGKFSSSPPRLI